MNKRNCCLCAARSEVRKGPGELDLVSCPNCGNFAISHIAIEQLVLKREHQLQVDLRSMRAWLWQQRKLMRGEPVIGSRELKFTRQ